MPRAALYVGVLKQKQEEFDLGFKIAGLQLKTHGLGRGILEQTKTTSNRNHSANELTKREGWLVFW